MKTFTCGSVVPGCTASFRAGSDAEILELVAAHARHDHGLSEIAPELAEQVRAHIVAA